MNGENGFWLTMGAAERGVIDGRMMNAQRRIKDWGHFYGVVQGMGIFRWGIGCILIRMGAVVGFRSSTQPTMGCECEGVQDGFMGRAGLGNL